MAQQNTAIGALEARLTQLDAVTEERHMKAISEVLETKVEQGQTMLLLLQG